MGALFSLPVHRDGKGTAVEDWKDQGLYISSWRISQRDLLDSIHIIFPDPSRLLVEALN